MVKYEYKDIAGSFKHGIKMPELFWVVLISVLSFYSAAYIATVIGICCTVEIISAEIIIIFCGGACVLLFVLSIFLGYYFYYIVYAKKQIILWLKDEDIVERRVEAWEFSSNGTGPFKIISIGVRFKFNDKSLTVSSKKYDKKFYKYANRDIKILYSPKYDQVLILK